MNTFDKQGPDVHLVELHVGEEAGDVEDGRLPGPDMVSRVEHSFCKLLLAIFLYIFS